MRSEVPREYEAVSESEERKISGDGDTRTFIFIFPHPLGNITLVAGRYTVSEDAYRDTVLRTYLLKSDHERSRKLLSLARNSIAMYGDLLGRFPCRSFSIVEIPGSAGLSFPTYALVGDGARDMPGEMEDLLGREIVRQWFGNHVYEDPEKEGWTGGLVTYLWDHWQSQMKGEGSRYRKRLLADFENLSAPVQQEIAPAGRHEKGGHDFSHGEKAHREQGIFPGACVPCGAKRGISRHRGTISLRHSRPTIKISRALSRVSWGERRGSF